MAIRFSDALPRDLRFEPTPKRVRARLHGETLTDSTAAILIWEPGRAVPVYAFPEADVRRELLHDSDDPIPDAHGGGAQFFTAQVDGERAENAAWRYADPHLRGHIAFSWEAMDRWLEEDEEVYGHPRDPWHRVDGRTASRHVHVALDGTTLADSRRPTIVFETGLPVRYYLPREDVRMDLLEPSETQTVCAYKGLASYWSVRLGDRLERDVAWTYERPLP